MKIIIFGLGSIGQRHARLLQQHFPQHYLSAFRSNRTARNNLGILELHCWDEVISLSPDVAFITNPTAEHVSTAIACLEKGMHLFIEKPLSNNLESLERLSYLTENLRKTVYVAYCLRFHPVILWLKNHLQQYRPLHAAIYNSSHLSQWRKAVNPRSNYSAYREKGGGIILDQSHEFDYIRYLFGPFSLTAIQAGRISNVTHNAEDYVDLLLKVNGLAITVHLNFCSYFTQRRIIIDFADHCIKADLIASVITEYRDNQKKEYCFPIELDEIYLCQLHYFFNNLNNPGFMNGLDEARLLFKDIISLKQEAVS
ncbi:Gfo/Idh/MocA family oxidoreductase [Candidatus Woesearchaeota archaeon]|nr:Gfo/Idh/MocA family oxidoreductase [Candidatus Woesearchaeota archaeon]